MAKYLLSHDVQSLILKYPRQYDKGHIYTMTPIIIVATQSSTKKVNMLKLMKKEYDILLYNQMIKLGEFGYCKYLAKLFGFYDHQMISIT